MSSKSSPGPRDGLHAVARRLVGRLFGPRRAAVGDRPRWTFRAPPLEGDQVRSIADLRGRALLLQFIGLG